MTRIDRVSIPLEGAVLEEVTKGVMLAALAVTDCNSNTLENVGKTSPWDVESVKLVTGSEEQARKPLGTILKEDMDLMLVKEFEILGTNDKGRAIDFQGYVAHNDDHAVLAFSSRTPAFDWLADFDTSTSPWKLEEDEMEFQSMPGFCHMLEGFGCKQANVPTVNAFFYQQFIKALPIIKKYIKRYLRPDERPRTLHVVGNSLGGAIATLAACYLMLEYDWNKLKHDLVVVTSGSPRVCSPQLKEIIDERRQHFNYNTRMYRLIRGADAVVTLPPPRIGGVTHLIDPVLITDSGKIGWQEVGENFDTDLKALTKAIKAAHLDTASRMQAGDARDDFETEDRNFYSRIAARLPKSLRDHFSSSYLTPLLKARGSRYGSLRECLSEESYREPEADRKSRARANRAKTAHYVPKMFRDQPELINGVHW
jgi:pimeloyl-ACP methyl ester carboxylesterase